MKHTTALVLLLALRGILSANEPPALRVQALHGSQPADPRELLRANDDGSFDLTASGREAFLGEDDGSFAHFETSATDWVFTARLRNAPEGTPTPKVGIAVREGLERWSRGVHLRYDGFADNQCLQWFYRHQVAGNTHSGARRVFFSGTVPEARETEGFWLRIVRHYPEFQLYRSLDGETWIPVATDRSFALLPVKMQVGLILTAGGDGKKSVTATFDQVRFQELPPGPAPRPEDLTPHVPVTRDWEMFLTHAGQADDPQNFFVLKPKNVEWKDLRGLLYSAGSKEIVIQTPEGLKNLPFEKGTGNLRKPVGMESFEGRFDLPPLDPVYEMYVDNGFARIGGAGHPRALPDALKKLAALTGYEGLQHMPIAVSGMSFAGGYTAFTANTYPAQIIAAAPTHLGVAGWETADPLAQKTPRLYVVGSHDTSHLKDMNRVSEPVRQRGSPWAFAPLWWYYHVIGHTQSLVLPYFFRAADLRLPPDADPSRGPVVLRELEESSGWLGINSTWESNNPRIVSWKDASGEERRGPNSWLPDEFTATVWRSAVSNWPRTVFITPRFDNTDAWSGPPSSANRHDMLVENTPFPLVAAGPLGANVKVTYYSGLTPLTVLRSFRDSPYLVEIAGLPAGTHVLYAVTEIDGVSEISRPQLIHVQKSK